MDPIKNPFSPGAGSPPPELVGRDPILEQARILLGRVKHKKSEKSMLLTGLRGVLQFERAGRTHHGDAQDSTTTTSRRSVGCRPADPARAGR